MKEIIYGKLPQASQELLQAARQAVETAYNPYSRFYVGAALLGINGEVIPGSNVENAAYGSTICAERSAIVAANAQEVRRFQSIALIARGADFDTTEVTAPCGSCRQMLYESQQVADRPLEVIMANTNMSKVIIATMDELLPLAFGPKDLGIDLSEF